MDHKKNISVCFTDQFNKFSDGKSTVVVVDILRATTVISTTYGRSRSYNSCTIFRHGNLISGERRVYCC